jgi:radical SAM superfamily enzyme YgiQ (UPF0313 family)
LPDWDRALFGDCSNSGNRFEEAVGISFSRGFCPFSCSFCGIDGYRRVNQQPLQGAVRLRSPEAVIAELLRIPDTVPVGKGYAAWDEVFPMQRKWVHRFAELYQEQIPHPLACQLRVEQITPDLVEQLQKARCNYAVIGVECGDENYRAKFLNKPFTNEKTIQAFQRLHDTGIETVASFMIGLPFETPKMLAKTIRLAQELQASELSWKYYTPERGTKLIELCQEHDLLIDKYIDSPFGGGEPMIKLVHCTPTDIRNATQALELLREGKPRGTFEQQHATPQKQRPLLEYRK